MGRQRKPKTQQRDGATETQRRTHQTATAAARQVVTVRYAPVAEQLAGRIVTECLERRAMVDPENWTTG
jgi:hypothetical protein